MRVINYTKSQLIDLAQKRMKGYAMNPRIQGRNRKAQQAAHRAKLRMMQS